MQRYTQLRETSGGLEAKLGEQQTLKMTYSQPIRVFHSLGGMIRRGLPSQTKVMSLPSMSFYGGLIRSNEVTSSRKCRSPEEMSFLASTYHTYLQSQEQYLKLYHTHFGKGEKSVAEAASIVGLKLPQSPKHSEN